MPTRGEPPRSPVVVPLEAGDQAATAGRWSEAVGIWVQNIDHQPGAATERIRWFLSQAPGTGTSAGVRQRTLFVAGVILGAIGTACVLVGNSQDGTIRNILAALAWISYLATAVLAVTYAYRSGHHTRGTARLGDHELRQALALAAELDRNLPPS